MTIPRTIAVIDIGKTNAKLVLVDLETLREIRVETRPNHVLPGPPYPHFDTDAIWEFILENLAAFQRDVPIDGITVTTHGASAALIANDGTLAAPILDYEHNGPDTLAAQYDAIRPDFAVTGSPRLGGGLNIGAQLHWQLSSDPELLDRTTAIVTYPQYWGYRLTGALACDASSLGTHTDLWEPENGCFSTLVDSLHIRDKIAPAKESDRALGIVLPEIAARTGLKPTTPVLCGIHDSNASLYPYILSQQSPFSVVSTGTWVISMAIGGVKCALDPKRDLLLNVNARGKPVPSARFMGGREFEMICGVGDSRCTQADIDVVLETDLMILPAIVPETGPFIGSKARWLGKEPPKDSGTRTAAASFYLALMSATCQHLIGGAGPIIVEGPFAQNRAYLQMLAAATGRAVKRSAGQTGTGIGAALLFADQKTPIALHDVPPGAQDMKRYAEKWLRAAEQS